MVVSDGHPNDTAITLLDGTKIQAHRATIHLDAQALPVIDLHLWMPVLQIKAWVEFVHFDCPICGQTVEHRCGGPDFGND